MFESTYYNKEERANICKGLAGVLFADEDNDEDNDED